MSWLSVIISSRLVPESWGLWIDCDATGRLVDAILAGLLFGLDNLLKSHHLLTSDVLHRNQIGRLIDIVEPDLLFLLARAAILVLKSREALSIRILLQH